MPKNLPKPPNAFTMEVAKFAMAHQGSLSDPDLAQAFLMIGAHAAARHYGQTGAAEIIRDLADAIERTPLPKETKT